VCIITILPVVLHKRVMSIVKTLSGYARLVDRSIFFSPLELQLDRLIDGLRVI